MVAQDERRDIVVLKVNAFDLATAPLGNSSDVKPGDKIFVIGNPLGAEELKLSISDGIISGVRDLNEGYKVLQITAPISPGNSGGPILDENAEVVGLVVFRLREGENLNFAVPINYVRGLLTSLDKSKPLKVWTKSAGTGDLFSVKEIHSRWKSVKTGAAYTLKFQGEYIYAEKDEPDDARNLGLFYTSELKKVAINMSATFIRIMFGGAHVLLGRSSSQPDVTWISQLNSRRFPLTASKANYSHRRRARS